MEKINSAPISVVIPCYNYGDYIYETVESIKLQSLKPAEIIVVDDGSTDNTPNICKSINGIEYIRKKNGGVSSARNVGYESSKSKYIMFIDADDVLLEKGLETLYTAIKPLEPEVSAVFGRADVFSSNAHGKKNMGCLPSMDDISSHMGRDTGVKTNILSKSILERLLKGNIVPQCSAIINKNVYESIGLWDENFFYHQDRDMWLRIATKFQIAYVNESVAGIRRHENNITNSKNWFRNHYEILEILKKTYKSNWADRHIQKLARYQYAFNAYNMAQRFADDREFEKGKKLMYESIKHNPKKLKSWIHYFIYSMKNKLNAAKHIL